MLCICFCVAETQLRKLPGLTLSAAGDACADLQVQFQLTTQACQIPTLIQLCSSGGMPVHTD